MTVLIDPPHWPAHGRLWAHLVSDESLAELHEFAAAQGLPERGFDHDHYDVPEEWHGRLVAAGAESVSANELVRRLIASGLRVRARDRAPRDPASQEPVSQDPVSQDPVSQNPVSQNPVSQDPAPRQRHAG